MEVTLAVAIASLAIITLLGLLPQGLEMSRKTSIMVTDSNILEQITRDLENAEFALLPQPNTTVRKYFNDQGREVQQDATDLAYVAEIEGVDTSLVKLPKDQTDQKNTLARMKIKIAASGSANFDFKNNNSALSYATFNQWIVKTR